MAWDIKCPICREVIDSHDSLADTKADLRYHLRTQHAEEAAKALATDAPSYVRSLLL